MIALFPGSFDPFTNGHLDVAERAAAVADRLIIGVGINPAKRGLIAPADRVDLIREATAHLTGVEVTALSGATMDEAARLGATLIVKGVRGAQDTDFEAPQAALNLEVGGVDTWWSPDATGARPRLIKRRARTSQPQKRCFTVCPTSDCALFERQ